MSLAPDGRRSDLVPATMWDAWRRHYLDHLLLDFLTAVFVDGTWLHRLWYCHRRPDRSFSVHGRQFHLCARCTGLVIGLLASPLVVSLNATALLWAAAIACAMLIVDGLVQHAGWCSSTNLRRLITGILAGVSVPAVLLNVVWRFLMHG